MKHKCLTLLNDAYQHCTDYYVKSEYGKLYHKEALEIIRNDYLKKEGEFHFDKSIQWMKANLDSYGFHIRLPIKRLLYMMNDYLIYGKFTTICFNYFESSYSYKIINDYDMKLIDDYIIFKKFSPKYNVKKYLLDFMWFMNIKYNGIKNMNYDELNEYNHYLLGNYTHSYISNAHGAVHNFLLYCYDRNIITSMSLCFMCNTLRFTYMDYMIPILKDLKKDFDKYGQEGLLINTNDRHYFDEFLELFIDKGSTSTKFKSIKIHLGCFYLFLDYTGYLANPKLIRFWADKIVGSYKQEYGVYRCNLLRYYDFITTGYVDFTHVYRKSNQYIKNIPEWAKPMTDDYLDYRKNLGYKSNTLCMDRNSILRFCLYLDNIGISSFYDVKSEHILLFNKYDKHSTIAGKNAYMIRIKNFLIFLHDKGLTSCNPNIHIATHMRTTQKSIETIDSDTLKKIHNSADLFTSPIEIRDYAITILGIRLGIRSIDIINLKLKDISYNKKSIHFIQAKTDVEMTLPMPNEVAQSIYRYVKYARPKSDSPYLFLGTNYHHRNIKRNVCNSAFKRVLKKLNINKDFHGFHSTRRTFATNTLKRQHDIAKTATVLGHTTMRNIDQYLNLNDTKMLQCSLSLQRIPYGGIDL